MITQETIEQFAYALKAMPERERLVLALYYLENLTLDEIGLMLDIDRPAVEGLIAGSMEKLRAEMAKED